MPIRELPPVPTRDDPANFALKGDAFLAALPGFRDDCNALEQSMQAMATTGTSTTSLTVGTGSKSLTTEPGKAWATGAWVYVFASAAVSNYMVGRVTSYNATTGALVVNVSAIDGSGTHSAWVIGLATPQIDTHLLPRDGSRAMTAELLLAANAVNELGAVPLQQMDAAIAAVVVYQPGQRVELFRATIPAGARLLKANGAAVPVSTYADMTAAIYCGDTNNATAGWGYRTSSNTNPGANRSTAGSFIVLPDARGRFGRGWADDGAIDTARSLWTYQGHQFEDHQHGVPIKDEWTDGQLWDYNGAASAGGSVGGRWRPRTSYALNGARGTETRPDNIAALVCIAY